MPSPAEMIEDIRREAAETGTITGRSSFSPSVMAVLADIPRSQFVPDAYQPLAYANIPLPISQGQTISQPYIVALMTDLLDLKPDHRCLEVGTGSGYQAAVLSRLTAQVYTVEIIPSLYKKAASRLAALGFNNVHCVLGSQLPGYPPQAPYDRILVAAAASRIPDALIEQLKPGGRMVIPVGPRGHDQQLYLLEKDPMGNLRQQPILAVRFVPLVDAREAGATKGSSINPAG